MALDVLVRDVRYALRSLLREPLFTSLAVVALALGTGASTAIFTVVDSVLLRPLPYAEPERLVVALHGAAATGPVSPADYLDYRGAARSFDAIGAAQAWAATLTGGDRPERLAGLQVSTSLFQVLGVSPIAGRTFVDDEDAPGRNRVVVLGHALWQRRFAADPRIVGRSISLDGEPYTVLGVMPPSFRFAPFWQTRAELWVPLSLAARSTDRSGRSLRVFARLKAGVTLTQAQAEMSAIAVSLAQAFPQTNARLDITIQPLLDKVVSNVRGTLLALLAMVTFVLLIACANVANGLLARASGRQREMALRAAIGASRGRIVRQLLTESLLLSAAGAAAGLLLAATSVRWLMTLLPPASLPRQQEVGLDLRVFLMAALATVACGVITGLAPAVQLTRRGLTSTLLDGAKGATEGGQRKHLRTLLVASEVGLALVLLVGAALMGRTMARLGSVDAGFATERVAVASVSLAGTPHAAAANRAPMFERLQERLAGMPGVSGVGAINHLPLAGDLWTLGYTIEGRPVPPPGEELAAAYRVVLPGYFESIGIRRLQGRDVSRSDLPGTPNVAVINKAMADRRWPGETAVGMRIYLPGPSRVQAPIEIVGVVADARQSGWTDAPADEVYLAYAQRAGEFGLATMTFVMRTTVEPEGVAASVAREVAGVDPGVPVGEATTMTAIVADELWRERLTAQLTGVFALIALGLAAIGVYAVVAYSVARRTREFGVRLALGASRASVVALALREAMRPIALGALAGAAATMAASRVIQAFLFEVSAFDPLAFAAAAAALIGVALAAAWLPARRASRLDPLEALRRE
jgi:predicted permease